MRPNHQKYVNPWRRCWVAPVFGLIICSFSLAQTPDSTNKDILAPLKKAQQENEQRTQVLSDLEKVEKEAESEQSLARQRKAEAEKQAHNAIEASSKVLNQYLADLEGYRGNLAQLKIQRSEQGQQNLRHITSAINEVREIKSYNLAQSSKTLRKKYYDRANQIWREIVDQTLVDLLSATTTDDLPGVPSPPDAMITSENDQKELVNKIIEAQNQAAEHRLELIRITEDLKRSQREISVTLLLSAGQVRAQTLTALLATNEISVWSLDEDRLMDLVREIQIVPYRFVAFFIAKFFDVEKKIRGGLTGWVDLIRQLVVILFLLVLPILLFKSFTRFSRFLDNWRTRLFTRSSLDFKTRTSLALWINRLNPYLPWIFALISLWLIGGILESTDLRELSSFLPYLGIYLYYRIFRMALSGLMGRILLSRNLDKVRAKQKEVHATARRLSILFFVEWALLHMTQDMVRQAIIYHMVWDLVVFVNIILIAFESKKWKSELHEVSKAWLPVSLNNLVARNASGLLELIISPALFVGSIIMLLLSGLGKWLSRFDMGKKLSSELFKRRLEEAIEGEEQNWHPPSTEYLQLFNHQFEVQDDTRVFLSRSPLRQCLEVIQKWENGKSEMDSLILYGNFGIGKTALLKSIAAKSTGLQVKYHQFQEKVTTSESLFQTLSLLLGYNFTNDDEFKAGEQKIEKTVLLLDDIHNLFLNRLGGLEAYKDLINLISLQTDNIFWCLSVNERAWTHLKGIFGETHIMAESIELKQWSDSEIQDLVMKRHHRSGFHLKFDRVISAVQKGDILDTSTGLEAQFFRLLWGQSRGNPATAQELWQSATQKSGAKTIRVGVPEFTRSRALSDATESTLMAFATIAKHETLSFSDLVETSGLTKSDLRQALKFGEDGDLLEKNSQDQWRLHPKAQYVICSYLLGRNLIYE